MLPEGPQRRSMLGVERAITHGRFEGHYISIFFGQGYFLFLSMLPEGPRRRSMLGVERAITHGSLLVIP